METLTRSFTFLLHKSGFKATRSRLALLEVLANSKHPLATHDIVKRLAKLSNQATIYRGLESLVETRMIRRVDMQHAHAHYELAIDKDHHHHIICTSCHRVEDLPDCSDLVSEKKLLKYSKQFSAINDHSLEFFGTCKDCAAKEIKRKKPKL